ncbi:MAG TPA: VOC family protein [Gammaproteobacteria bacterium]|nr:VOC family protein [Luteimonas sp.]HRO27863.1 VOC family protein [Luteimonas sp.]HRP35820.1 VOC family protein [Gammaproteobacteria bacterium]HRP73757.1 VOC family protein [Luteimonas sp.]
MQALHEPPAGLPGLRGVEHIGFTVPDLDAATRFFVDVIGCTQVYSLGPLRDPDGDWMSRHLNVPASAVVRELRFFRCGHGPNFELFEYAVDDQVTQPPRNCDVGGHHLAFYVDDIDAAVHYLRRHGVRILGEPTVRSTGPSAGQTWVYVLTPWGMQLELVSFPHGKAYEKDAAVKLWNPTCPAE